MSTPWPDSEAPNTADTETRSLYRRSLKLALDWAVHRYLWRGQALYIRSLFEKNRDVSDPRLQRVCKTFSTRGGDKGLDGRLTWKHRVGTAEGDGETAGEVEASGPLLPPDCPRRCAFI